MHHHLATLELEQPRLDDSILQRIGNTPLVRVVNVAAGVRARGFSGTILAKAEWFNPGGSVKDRPALRMIEDAERAGRLTPGKVILDSTSGNTGIAYAMVGAVKGYRVHLVMPANVSEERKRIVAAFGGTVTYTDPLEGSDGAIREARRLRLENPDRYYMPDQYNNPSNPRAHYDGTGAEILEQTRGQVTHFVAAIGTSGTLMGIGRRLKDHDPNIKVYAVEPAVPLHGIEGLKHMATAIVPGIYDPSWLDGIIPVETEEAYHYARALARDEGLLVGQSSGAALAGALRLAATLNEGTIVTVFPDSGDKYLSTSLFQD